MRRLSLRANPGGFLADFDAATVVCPFSTKRGYLRMFPDVPISIGLTHESGDTYVSLEMFEAHPGVRGTGAGTEAMRRILDLADKHGLSVYLDPHPLDEGWSWERLVKWYASFGFAFEEEDAEDRKQSGNYWMQRLPHAKGTRRSNPRQSASAFARWFGASKVVDEQGQPLVVYHGTVSDFDRFDAERIGANFSMSRGGFFFVSNKEAAWNYAHAAASPGGVPVPALKPRVISAYLSLKNPLIVAASDTEWPDMYFDDNAEDILRRAHRGGHDGVIVHGIDPYSYNEPRSIYIAFRPEQIKSATSNAGTFDPADPNIYRNPRTHSRTRTRTRSRR